MRDFRGEGDVEDDVESDCGRKGLINYILL